MNLEREKLLAALLWRAYLTWLIGGVGGVIIGALTDRSPWWLLPMIVACLMLAAAEMQAWRVRKLESRQR